MLEESIYACVSNTDVTLPWWWYQIVSWLLAAEKEGLKRLVVL